MVNVTRNFYAVSFRWGVYGQLGHGDTENVAEPKVVSFLKFKVKNNQVYNVHNYFSCCLCIVLARAASLFGSCPQSGAL